MNGLKQFGRYSYVFFGPFFAFLLPALIVAVFLSAPFTRSYIMANNVVDVASRNRLLKSIRDFSNEQKGEPISTFDGKLVVAIKKIEKGEVIAASSVSETKISPFEPNEERQKALPLDAVGCKVAQQIDAGKLVSLTDIDAQDRAKEEAAIESMTKKDNPSQMELLIAKQSQEIKDSKSEDKRSTLEKVGNHTVGRVMSTGLMMPLLIMNAGLLIFVVGQIGLLVGAFSTNVLWGVAFILIPFASSFFEINNWQVSRKFIHITVLGSFLIGLALGSVFAVTSSTMSVTDWVTQATDGSSPDHPVTQKL